MKGTSKPEAVASHAGSAPQVRVAVLLSTYNGARFIEPQIKSLKENVTPFTLHWINRLTTPGRLFAPPR
jgi:uncharacterized protein YprB with RNaseH-like and TPR domain